LDDLYIESFEIKDGKTYFCNKSENPSWGSPIPMHWSYIWGKGENQKCHRKCYTKPYCTCGL